MQRIKSTSAIATLPATVSTGSPGYFRAPDDGVQTIVTNDWANGLQEELITVIEAAGLTPDIDNNAQLLAALQGGVLFGATTGEVKLTFNPTAASGWVTMNDGSIGSATSGASTRANADTFPLYSMLWTNVSNTFAPVSTGRGASATADFAANKTLTLPRALGRALGVAGAGASLTSRALGEFLGEETHVLTIPEMPAHHHTFSDTVGTGAVFAGGANFTNATVDTSDTGGDLPHNNMQPTLFIHAHIKL